MCSSLELLEARRFSENAARTSYPFYNVHPAFSSGPAADQVYPPPAGWGASPISMPSWLAMKMAPDYETPATRP
jgi:hypothetical protein